MSRFCVVKPGKKINLPMYNIKGEKVGEYTGKRQSGAVIAALKAGDIVPRYRKIKNGDVQMSGLS